MHWLRQLLNLIGYARQPTNTFQLYERWLMEDKMEDELVISVHF